MKITAIRCYVLEAPAPAPLFHWRKGLAGSGDGTPPGEPTYSALLKVETDAGIVGMAGSGNGYATASLVRRRLQRLVGMDPLWTEQLWKEVWEIDRLEEMTMIQLGLLDVACWDIKSRAAGLPVYALLGGHDNRVPAYASTVTWDTLEEYERHIKECLDAGFRAFKLHAWGDARED